MKEQIEEWRDIAEYSSHYQVSNLGNVRSKAVFIPHDGNWNKDVGGYTKHIKLHNQQKNRYGYMSVKLCRGGACKNRLVHRLVALAFIPTNNPKLQINHKDGVKTNNTIDNLEWVSAGENSRHAWATGLITSEHLSGSNHHAAILDEEKVKTIRQLYKDKKATQDELVALYGIKKGTLKDLLYGRTWKKVD